MAPSKDRLALYNKFYNELHREEIARRKKKYASNNKKQIMEYREATKEQKAKSERKRYLKNKEFSHAYQRRWRRDRLIKLAGCADNGTCDICEQPETAKKHGNVIALAFDHCHSKNIFRGWLCRRCNHTLGQVQDNPSLLLKMAKYLEDFELRMKQQGKQF